MSIEFDFSELNNLAANLGEVSEKAGKNVAKAVEVTANKVKNDWRKEAQGMDHAPAFPYSIGYDIAGLAASGATAIEAEIGPDKDRPQGALGNLIEFGSVHNPPQGLGHGALNRNEEDFEYGLSKALEDAEGEAGL